MFKKSSVLGKKANNWLAKIHRLSQVKMIPSVKFAATIMIATVRWIRVMNLLLDSITLYHRMPYHVFTFCYSHYYSVYTCAIFRWQWKWLLKDLLLLDYNIL